MALKPDQVARLIFNGVSLPLLAVAALVLVFVFSGHVIAGAVTCVVFAGLVVVLVAVIRPLIFRRVLQKMSRPGA